MAEQGNEYRVGVTLAVAGVVLVVGILWLGGVKFGDDRYEIGVVFTEVAGLAPGDKVTMAGLEAGEVLDLKLANGKVLADLEIDEDIRIPIDSRISVASYGLIGAKNVSIRPGVSDTYIQPGATVNGLYEKGLGDVVSEMGEALTEIRQVLKAADEVLTDVEGRERVKETLGDASVAARDFRSAVSDLKATAAELRAFVDEKKAGASQAIDSMEDASAGFAEVSHDLQTMTASLDSIIGRVERGEGSLGMLISDTGAHDEFVAAVREVRDLIAEIRRNPKTFIRFSIF